MPTVRTITADEIPAHVAATRVGFGNRAEPDAAEPYLDVLDPQRCLAAFDDDAIVGTAAAFPTRVSVPGGLDIDAAGVTVVTVMPTHRRRGLLTEMMRQQLDDVQRREEPLAILVAAEAPIYGRFGYGPATWRTTLTIDTRAAAFDRPPPHRDLRFVEIADLAAVAPSIYERVRTERPGMIAREPHRWEFRLGQRGSERDRTSTAKRFAVISHDQAGAADGWAVYELGGTWTAMRPTNEVVVHEMMGATAEAEAALWRYLLDQDWAVSLKAEDRPLDDALPWLLVDQRQVVLTDTTDFVWARVLDVERCLAGRRYGTTDRLVIEVTDRFLPDSGGRFALDGSPDGAACERTEADPDLVIEARELGAAYLGGTALGRAARAGRVEERTAGAVARFDRLFRSEVEPWCNTMF
ncbi:MAG: GNAT family N-acetyltransferase [Acidimicrobiales bacterium]